MNILICSFKDYTKVSGKFGLLFGFDCTRQQPDAIVKNIEVSKDPWCPEGQCHAIYNGNYLGWFEIK